MKPVSCRAALLGLALVMTTALDATRAESAGNQGPARFEPLVRELSRARSAVVAVGCGTPSAPWAYRGARGDSLELKALKWVEMDERWARDLAQALMVKSDWDSAHRFIGITKPCREARDPPHFIVTWRAKAPEIYALFSFEFRCALVFEARRPLGTIWFRDRADTLFAAIRGALAADSSIRAMPTPAEFTPKESPSPFGSYVWVEELPEAIEKVPPEYPVKAREEGRQGTVEIRALIGKDGLVHDAFVHKSVGGLDDAALACVWEWKFKPAMADGKPVAVWVAIPVKFTLE